MGFWCGFLIGLFVGGSLGVFVMALCAASRSGDDLEENKHG